MKNVSNFILFFYLSLKKIPLNSMKKIVLFLFPLFLLSLTSCSEPISCNGKKEKALLKEILKKELAKNKDVIKYNGIENIEENLDKFLDNNVIIQSVRPVAKDKELKLYKCKAILKYGVDNELQRKFDSILAIKEKEKGGTLGEKFKRTYEINGLKQFIKSHEDEITYTVQRTLDDQLYCKLNLDDKDLEKILGTFIVNTVYNQSIKDKKQNDTPADTRENKPSKIYTLKNVKLIKKDWYEGYFLTFKKPDGGSIELYYPGDNLENVSEGKNYDVEYRIKIYDTDLEGNPVKPYESRELVNISPR